jgi:hypothetical protein
MLIKLSYDEDEEVGVMIFKYKYYDGKFSY